VPAYFLEIFSLFPTTFGRIRRENYRSAITTNQCKTGARAHTLRLMLLAALIACLGPLDGAAQSQQPAIPVLARIQGRVVDSHTGQNLARALVLDEVTGRAVVTDHAGHFELSVPPGRCRLFISAVGYVVAHREVDATASRHDDLIIPLAEGTGTYTENVTVGADPFRSSDPTAPSQQVLRSADIQNLRGVLADDPLRAVQVLSGVATGDDLRSEFSVRGSDFGHISLTVDGFATPFRLHTVRAVEDHANTGSVAMINSDILEDVALLNGGYAQRTGNRTGASLAFRVREGSRERGQIRAAVSGTSASCVAEGPLGPGQQGSWLISGRQSYLDALIERLADEGLTFGFSDAQAKLVYDVNTRQRVHLTMIAGRSRLGARADEADRTEVFTGRNRSAIAIGGWRLTLGRTAITAGLLGATNRFRNDTIDGVDLDHGSDSQLAGRFDVTHQLSRTLQLESGGEIDRLHETRTRQRPAGATFTIVNDYAGAATRTGGYALVRWLPSAKVSVTPGARMDHWSLTEQTNASPWVQAEWRLFSNTTFHGSAGVYQQFADFEQILGAWGRAGLAPERAAQFDAGVERRLGTTTRVQITIFDREERNFMRRPDTEMRLSEARLVRGSASARYENRLDGYARGVELLAQRRNPNGLTGWISYSYAKNRYADRNSGEAFWGDLDQRHTLNMYLSYRATPRVSVSGKLRVGSNFPAPGYFADIDGRYFLSDRRNDVRLPAYARVDLRANRTFQWSQRRLTVFGEVMNLFNRDNVRFNPPSIDTRTREVRGLFEPMIPIVPSAGVLIEF
jgi:hypothetical protein